MSVEDEVVGAIQRHAVAGIVEPFEPACFEIHTLDAPAGIVRGRADYARDPGLAMERQTAVVADVDSAVRADRGAVRAAAEVGDHGFLASAVHAYQEALGDLDKDDGAVGKGDRSLGEKQALAYDFRFVHGTLPAYCHGYALPCETMLRMSRCLRSGTAHHYSLKPFM